MIDKVSKTELVRIAKTKGFTEAQISKMSFDELSALISNTEVKTTGTLYKGFNFLDQQSTQKTNFNGNIWSAKQTSAVSNEADLGFVKTQIKPQTLQQAEKPVISAEQAQDFSIEQISQNTQSALNLFLAQQDNQGIVSKGYDEIKNLLKTKLSSTRINKAIDNEITGLNFLSQAKDQTLTKREYYEQNKQRLLEMIPDFATLSEAQKQNIKARIDSLPINEIKEFQHKIAMLPNKNKHEYKQEFSAMLAELKSSTETPTLKKGGIEGQQFKTKMKVNKPNTDMNSEELISYEEVFKYERGVEYSKENIQNFEEKKAALNFVSGAKQKYEQLKQNGGDVKSYEERFNKILNGKTYEQYQQDYAASYTSAYGTKNAEELAKAFGEDQENINAKATGAVQIAGMGSMVIGGVACLIPGAQPIGAGMISVGGKMALGGMLAKTALDVVNESTRKNGMSDEAAKAIIKEAAINAGSFAIGMGAGATGAKVGASLIANGSSKLMSVVAERGVDFTISALGDLAMIGDVNLQGNMMGVVTATALGLKTGKNVMKNHVADEVPTVKPPETTFTGEKTNIEVVPTAPTKIPVQKSTQDDLAGRLKTAASREDFAAIRDKIKTMENGQDKTNLMAEYQVKYREWSSSPDRPDIRMEYKQGVVNTENSSGVNSKTISEYAKLLQSYSSVKGKDATLTQSSDITINTIKKLMDDLSPAEQQKVFNAAVQLFEGKSIRNTVADTIIKACLVNKENGVVSFNEKAFAEVKKLFDSKENDGFGGRSDFSYSLRVAEMAKSAERYVKKTDGEFVKTFDMTNFEIAKLYNKCNKDIVHLNFKDVLDDNDLIDIDKLDDKSREYIIQNMSKNADNSTNFSDDIFDRDKIEQVFRKMGFSERNNSDYLFPNNKFLEKYESTPEYGLNQKRIYFGGEDFERINKMVNYGDNKNFWKNLDQVHFVEYCLRMKNMFNENELLTNGERTIDVDIWNTMINYIKNKKITDSQSLALNNYVGDGYSEINMALTNKKNGDVVSSSTLKMATDLSELIDAHQISGDIRMNRTERNLDRFSDVKLKDGTSLSDILNNQKKYVSQLETINAELKDIEIVNERFMSATIRDGKLPMSGINWEMNVKKGSKALFVNTYNTANFQEYEYLIKNNSTLKNLKIELDWRGHLILKADVIAN